MITRLQRWGKGQGLSLSKKTVKEVHLSIGDEVNVSVRRGVIVVTPLRTARGKPSVRGLVSRIPENYSVEEMDWGEAVGREAW